MTADNLDSEQLFHKALATGEIDSQDGQYAIEFIQKYSTLKNSSKGTILKYFFVLKAILKQMRAMDVSLATLTENATYSLFNSIRNGRVGNKKKAWSESTRAGYWKVFILFYRWTAKRYGKAWEQTVKDLIYDGDKTDRLIYRLDKKKVVKKSTFTPEEVVLIINTEPNLCYKVFFALLFDSGMRGGEAFSITLKSVEKKPAGSFILQIEQSKTTIRQVVIERGTSIGISYLDRWMTVHPHKGNPDKPLFCNTLGEPLSQFAANKQLKHLVKKIAEAQTDSEKRKTWLSKNKVSLHSFRHSRATDLANRGMSSELMGKLVGWAEGSQMPATYIRSAQLDAQAALRRAYGIEKAEEKKVESKVCLNCQTLNDIEKEYCDLCNMPLSHEKISQIHQKVDLLRIKEAYKEDLRKEFKDLIAQLRSERQAPTSLVKANNGR